MMIHESTFVAIVCTMAAVATSGSSVNEPMVAFVCNRPAMHRTNRGWVRDETTGCITDPIDILSYCRKTYSDRDVWNVVESNEMVTIKNWCNSGHTKCRHRFTVRPFRCLVGPFQSEALQVPDKCVFDHVHGPSTTGGADCQSSAEWNQTARQACIDRHGAESQLHGFAVLQPCGIDGFGGVEFVCCPASSTVADAATTLPNAAVKPPSRGHHHARRTTRIRPEMTSAATRPTMTTMTTTTTTAPTTRTTTVATTTAERTTTLSVSNNDDLDDDEDVDVKEEVYMVTKPQPVITEFLPTESVSIEYDWFSQAKAELEKRHHDKVTKMMREWAAARKRVQEIKNIDVKGGEKFNREMTARFQKAYESLEHDTATERKKLVSEHQKRVEDSLNKKKTQAMDIYTAAINSPHADATKVLNALVQYVKTEQRDRVHTINYYERVEESDPVEAEAQRAAVAAHLRGIDQRVTRAIEMLTRLPKYEKKIRQQIEKFLSSYQSLDESLAVIMAKINEKTNGNRPLQPTRQQQDQDEYLLTSSVSSATDDAQHGDTSTTRPVSEKNDETTALETSTGVGKQTVSVAAAGTVEWTSTVKQSVTEQQHHSVDLKPIVGHASHNMKNEITVLESYIKKLPLHADTSGHVAAPLAIVAVGAALFVVILAGVAFVRRRSLLNDPSSMDAPGCSTSGGSVDINPVMGVPADAKVPINGYENPTYQYYTQTELAARHGAAVAAGQS